MSPNSNDGESFEPYWHRHAIAAVDDVAENMIRGAVVIAFVGLPCALSLGAAGVGGEFCGAFVEGALNG